MYRVTFINMNGEKLISPIIDDNIIFDDKVDAFDYAYDVIEYFEYIFDYYLDFNIERV